MTERLPRIWQKPLENAIHVDVCRNGDSNFRKRVVLNKKRQPTFDSWLRDLSTCMKLRTGAVWRVFTPTSGHRLNDYESLEDGNVVVVAGQEGFKPLRYTAISSRRKSPRRPNDLPETVRKIQASARHNKGNTKATIIKCWENGKGLCGCKQVLLPPRSSHPQTLEEVIDLVSKTMDFVVERLYQMDGAKVVDVSEIVPYGCYVAAPRQKRFIMDRYSEGPPRAFDCSPHGRPQKLPALHGKTSGHSSTEPSRNGSENDYSHRRRHRQLPPLSYSNKTSSQSSPEHSESSRNGSDTNDHSHRSRNRQRQRKPYHAKDEEESEVLTRPAKPRRSERQRQTDYDQDSGGVFKAKGQNRNTTGARPVEDSRSTRTELPVDQRKAEPVMDEESSPRHTQHEPERAYRTNARRAHSPSNEEARKEKERQARQRREDEDRARAEKQRRQQEALLQRKKEKEEQKKKQEEEERKRRQEEEEKRKAERERERQKKEEERKKQKEKQREEEKKKAAQRNPTPDRRQDTPQRQGTETLQDKDAEKEEWAATTIQAGFRGYKDRQNLKKTRGEDRRSNLSETESIPILGEDDQDLGPGPDDNDDDRFQQEKAATKIQAGFRGAKARREVEVMRTEKAANQAKDEEERAATKIQAGFRGARSRREVEAMRAEKAAQETRDREEKAATKIQAGFRGFKTRQELNEKEI